MNSQESPCNVSPPPPLPPYTALVLVEATEEKGPNITAQINAFIGLKSPMTLDSPSTHEMKLDEIQGWNHT